MLMESEHNMAREDRDGSGIGMVFTAIPPEGELGGVAGQAPRVIVDKGPQGDTEAQSATRQIVVRHGTVKMTGVKYDSLSVLTGALRLG